MPRRVYLVVQMRKWVLLLLALGIACFAAMKFRSMVRPERSAGRIEPLVSATPAEFEHSESAGLFIGSRNFRQPGIMDVKYAVDDAVDLAYTFSIQRRTFLVPPNRVVLALSGKPTKAESRQRLEELKNAGADVRGATAADILRALKTQTAITGETGIFILSLATHGFMHNGNEYILGSDSIYRKPTTSLPVAKLLDIVAMNTTRSLVFVDACRDRVVSDSRSAGASELPPTIERRMKNVAGQAVFYAAAPGGYAYDSDGNGVFTKAVLEGLCCKASAPNQVVRVDTLRAYVTRTVREWYRLNNKPNPDAAIQVNIGGNTHLMPLAHCWDSPRQNLTTPFTDRHLIVRDENKVLWEHDFPAPIHNASAADINADGLQEIVVAYNDTIEAFNDEHKSLWQHTLPGLRKFITANLLEKHAREIAVLTDNAIYLIDGDGKILGNYNASAPILDFAVDRPTAHWDYRIIAITAKSLFVIKPHAIPRTEWRIDTKDAILRKLTIIDYDNDSYRDIVVKTSHGDGRFTFKTAVIGKAPFQWKRVKSNRPEAQSLAALP